MTSAPWSPLIRRGESADGPYLASITPRRAGWAHSSLRILELPPGAAAALVTGPEKMIVLPAARASRRLTARYGAAADVPVELRGAGAASRQVNNFCAPEAFGADRLIADGDIVLIPHGYHGPSMAAPGYDLYYLTVMAGPGKRAWRFCDDPAHAWVRSGWAGQPVDPRLPLTSAAGRAAGAAT